MSGYKEGRVVSVDGDTVTMDLLAGVVRYYLLVIGTMYSDCVVSCNHVFGGVSCNPVF